MVVWTDLCERFCLKKQGCLGMSADRSRDILAECLTEVNCSVKKNLGLVTVTAVALDVRSRPGF